MKDLLRIADLAPDDVDQLLCIAERTRSAPRVRRTLLEGDTVLLCFAEPSTRTRLSFASAVARLGGAAQIVGPQELQRGRGESIEDTARLASPFARALVIRTFADDDVARAAAAASIPVVNAGTGRHHPCPALADLMTLRCHFGRLAGLRVAYLGEGNNAAHSLIEACALAGVRLTVACPAGHPPDPAIVRAAQGVAWRSGGELDVVPDVERAVRGADAVHTGVWPQSLVRDQVENRLYTAQAVLEALVLGQLAGAGQLAGVG